MSYFQGLNDQQVQAIENVNGPLLILAGAGSGKTRVITTRIAHLIDYHGIPPYRILAMTFTNKAAREMKERVEHQVGSVQPELTISTFHAFGARFLRKEIDFLGRDSSFVIFDTQDQDKVIKGLLKGLKINVKDVPVSLVRNRISRLKNKMKDAPFLDPELEKKLVNGYEAEMLKQNAVDFDDLLLMTNQILEASEACRLRYQRRFQHVLVDEYQDTNRVQFRMLTLLCGENPNLCVVGDEDQSIYSWRGADIKNILDFEKTYENARTIKLEQNYRSTQEILNLANRVISRNKQRKPKELWSSGDIGNPASFRSFLNGRGEAEAIARTIKMKGYPHRSVAVLFRANYLSRVLEEAFRKEKIPYQLIGGLKFYDRKEIKDILSYARCMVNDHDWTSFSRAVNTPSRGIGAKSLDTIRIYFDETGSVEESLQSVLKQGKLSGRAKSGVRFFLDTLLTFRQSMSEQPPSEWLNQLIKTIDYRDALRKEDLYSIEKREDNINELLASIREAEKTGTGSMSEFLDLSSLVSDQDQLEGDRDQVSLMTVHAAKGLEFESVFVMGLEEGVFPNRRSVEESPSGLEEERRLFYVAVTRAKKNLYLSHSKTRMSYGSYMNAPPSRFLKGLDRGSEMEESPDIIYTSKPEHTPQVETFLVGDSVIHPVFGKGVVLVVAPKGLDTRLTIRFPTYGTRVFLKSRAPLKKAD